MAKPIHLSHGLGQSLGSPGRRQWPLPMIPTRDIDIEEDEEKEDEDEDFEDF